VPSVDIDVMKYQKCIMLIYNYYLFLDDSDHFIGETNEA